MFLHLITKGCDVVMPEPAVAGLGGPVDQRIGFRIMGVYTGDRFPQWRGSLFVGGMARQRLVRLTLEGRRVVSEEGLVPQMGRIRDIRQGPEGDIYLVRQPPGAADADSENRAGRTWPDR